MKQVVVCGLGQVGYRVTNLLLRLGCKVTVISHNNREEFVHEITKHGASVIDGDVRTDSNLKLAGIESTDALLACADKDLTNIEVALDANRLNPKTTIVARLFDQSLARRLESSMGINRALAMSSLAAPAFASAAFGESISGAFSVGGSSYIAGSVTGSDRLRRLVESGEAELVRIRGPLNELTWEPTLDECEKPHNMVDIIATTAAFLKLTQLDEATLTTKIAKKQRSRLAARCFEAARSTSAIWENMPRQLKIVALVILTMAILSVFIFQIGMGLSTLDSVYFVVTTLTTTGYGDITPKDASVAMKLYGCLVMLIGSAMVATLYSIVTDFVVSTRFDQVLGRQKVASNDHVVVVGLGNVGYRTVVELRTMGAEVVVIDLDPEAEYRTLLDRGTAYIVGDGRDLDTLTRAGIDRATAVVSATHDDAVNLSVALTARSLNPEAHTVVRLFEDDFCRKVKSSMNITSAMSATLIAAPGFVGAALFPDSVYCYVVGDRFIVVRPANAQPNALAIRSRICFAPAGGGARISEFELKTFPDDEV